MAPDPPPLTRAQLERILGLAAGTPIDATVAAAIDLVARLAARRDGAEASERAALDAEIADLSASVSALARSADPRDASGPRTRPGRAVSRSRAHRDRLRLGMLVVLTSLFALLFVGYLNLSGAGRPSLRSMAAAEPARLVVTSRPQNADLRIRPPDSDELLLKIDGRGANIELPPGAYALEVSRPDCPDVWREDIELEPGESRRYEPTICVGAGELVVRSNVSDDRLRVDDLDLGATREAPHLLGVGDHVVRVDKPGYAGFEGKVRIRPDERIELRATLSASDSGPPGTQAASTEKQAAPLPFDVVAPSQPPALPRAHESALARDASPAEIANPLLPGPMRPERFAVPRPELDFDSTRGLGSLAKGGSTTWHDAIVQRVLSRYDADGSGAIDRGSETEAIPCSFWKEVERSFDEGGLGLSMSRLYGFDGSEWHPNALGFARAQRGLAYERMQACGLEP